MRKNRLLILLAAGAVLAVPAAGADAAGRLSLHVANHAADREAAAVADDYTDDADTTIEDYDLSPCDRVGRRKAECDVTYSLSDGSECDDTIDVRLTSRGRAVAVSESEDGDGYTFDDCTDPADDSGDDTADDAGSDDAGSDVAPADDGSNL